MNAPSKVSAKQADANEPDNMALWRAVETTDPRHTKKVNQRGGFTAIGANYQIMKATEQWGPLGIGWGYDASDPLFHDCLVFVSVTLWHGDRANRFGPVHGGAEWKSPKGHLDSDAPKKAGTDGLTKLLSQLGFNADVFLGRFDDNKYVEALEAEIAREEQAAKQPAHSALKTAVREFVRQLHGCGDFDQFVAFVDLPESKELIDQVRTKLPQWFDGWDEQPDGFTPLGELLAKRRTELEALENA